MTKKRWYAVADTNYNLDQAVWTVSTNPDSGGWITDNGYPGYGLTKADAKFLAQAANEKLDREAEARRLRRRVARK